MKQDINFSTKGISYLTQNKGGENGPKKAVPQFVPGIIVRFLISNTSIRN